MDAAGEHIIISTPTCVMTSMLLQILQLLLFILLCMLVFYPVFSNLDVDDLVANNCFKNNLPCDMVQRDKRITTKTLKHANIILKHCYEGLKHFKTQICINCIILPLVTLYLQ